jgi:hypothetical protein
MRSGANTICPSSVPRNEMADTVAADVGAIHVRFFNTWSILAHFVVISIKLFMTVRQGSWLAIDGQAILQNPASSSRLHDQTLSIRQQKISPASSLFPEVYMQYSLVLTEMPLE